jgi:hypothetical protein
MRDKEVLNIDVWIHALRSYDDSLTRTMDVENPGLESCCLRMAPLDPNCHAFLCGSLSIHEVCTF